MLKISKKRVFVSIAVVGLLVFLYLIGLLKPVERIATRVFNPISSGFHTLGSDLRTSYNNKANQENLLEENKELHEQVNQLIEENVELKITRQENEVLREQLGFLTRNEYKYVMSNVIARGDLIDISDRSETIIIDKGSQDGVQVGLAVVTSKGIIVGKVVEVKENISQVYLTNNAQCKLAATVLDQEKTSGVTEGELGLTVRMNFIPQDQIINPGDIVVTSGLEQYIPRGLVIGQVTEVNKESNELWQNAVIQPLVEAEDLVIVSVLLPFE